MSVLRRRDIREFLRVGRPLKRPVSDEDKIALKAWLDAGKPIVKSDLATSDDSDGIALEVEVWGSNRPPWWSTRQHGLNQTSTPPPRVITTAPNESGWVTEEDMRDLEAKLTEDDVTINFDNAMSNRENYTNETSRRAISLLSLLSGLSITKKVKRRLQRSKAMNVRGVPKDNIVDKLQPCPIPPPPRSPEADLQFRKQFLYTWGIWDYMVQNDQFNAIAQRKLNEMRPDMTEDEKALFRYDVVTTACFTNAERRECQLNVRINKSDYRVTDILAIWFASDDCCRQFGVRQAARAIWLQNHTFPIGKVGKPTNITMKSLLPTFYDCPNVILSLYIYYVALRYAQGTLSAYKSDHGLIGSGFHYVDSNISVHLYLPGLGKIIPIIRLAGFAHAVVNDYHRIICDDAVTYIDNYGEKQHYGLDFMIHKAHTCHLQCFRDQICGNSSAGYCVSLGDHLACSANWINLSANEKCNGNQLSIFHDEHGTIHRFLHSNCKCGDLPGNPSGARCTFTTIRHLKSEASIYEKRGTRKGGKYTYIEQERTVQRNTDSIFSTEPSSATTSFPFFIDGNNANSGGRTEEHNVVPEHCIFTQSSLVDELQCIAPFIFDIESSGLDSSNDRMLQIGCISLLEKNSFGTLVNPKEPYEISIGAHKVNGIKKAMLVGSPDTSTALDNFFAFLDQNSGQKEICLIGHNIHQFDVKMIYNEAKRYDLQDRLRKFHYVDTLEMSKDGDAWKDINKEEPLLHNLSYLHEYLFEEKISNAHSAIGDCLATARTLLMLDPAGKYTAKYMKRLDGSSKKHNKRKRSPTL